MPKSPAYYKPYTLPPQPRIRPRDYRASAPERGYDAAWAKLRNTYIARHPMCQFTGCQQPGEIVDHIKPIVTHPHLRLDMDNLQTLCRSHHGVKTAADLRKERKG